MTGCPPSTTGLSADREDAHPRAESPVLAIDALGNKRWILNDKHHRLDGPAIEWFDGSKYWYVDDELHRLDGPACEFFDGTKAWYFEGRRHRLDGPACEHPGGGKEWWVNGKLHRSDGPAVDGGDGYEAWYVHGKRHRLGGPAIERADGYKAWCLYGQDYTEEQFHAKVALLRKLLGNLKAKRFLRLTRHNRQFIESFYAEGGMGRKWDLASLERMGIAIEL